MENIITNDFVLQTLLKVEFKLTLYPKMTLFSLLSWHCMQRVVSAVITQFELNLGSQY